MNAQETMPKWRTKPKAREPQLSGFTILELLILTIVILFLVTFFLPQFTSRPHGSSFTPCLNHGKQLALAWMLYSEDNRNTLVPNPENADPARLAWVYGNMRVESDRANATLIKKGLLFPYAKSPDLFKCTMNDTPRVRDVSMNPYLGNSAKGAYQYFTNQSQIPHPSQTFVTIEEDPKSIGGGSFLLKGQPLTGALTLNSLPSTAHGGRGIIAFADGHAEMRRWTPQKPPTTYNPAVGYLLAPDERTNAIYLLKISTVPTNGNW